MGCNGWNHHRDCNCGWGGDTGGSANSNNSGIYYAFQNTIFYSFTIPNLMCPVCGELVFYYENQSGSKVYFDELGPPWPKHGCFYTMGDSVKNSAKLNAQTQKLNLKPLIISKSLRRNDNIYCTVKVFDLFLKEKEFFFIYNGLNSPSKNTIYFFEDGNKEQKALHYFDISSMKSGFFDIKPIHNKGLLLLLAKNKCADSDYYDQIENWYLGANNNKYGYDENRKIVYLGREISPKSRISIFLWLTNHSGWNEKQIKSFTGFSEFEFEQLPKIIREKKIIETSPIVMGLVSRQAWDFLNKNIKCIYELLES